MTEIEIMEDDFRVIGEESTPCTEPVNEEIFKDRNKDLLQLFSKFEGEKNYKNHLEYLTKLSQFYVREIIHLGTYQFPDIGPDPEILNFHLTLKDWDQEKAEEVKSAIKIYEGGNIESLEEAIILIEILKRNHPEKKADLEKLTNDLMENKFKNLFDYQDILKIEDNHPNHIIFSSLFFYFATLLE